MNLFSPMFVSYHMRQVFFISILLILFSAIAYVVVRGVQSLAAYPIAKHIYWTTLALMFLLMMAGFFMPTAFPSSMSKGVTFIGFSFLILLLYLFFTFLLIDVVRIIHRMVPFIADMASFRFRAAVAGIALTVLIMIIGHIRFLHPKTVHLEVKTENASKGKSMKIVAVSDLHLGVSIDRKMLRKYVSMIQSEQPDLILFAGDIIDRSVQAVIDANMHEEFRQLHAPLGVFAVLGNHEYYGEGLKKVQSFLEKSHITLLRDSVVAVNEDVYLVGRDDAANQNRKNLQNLTQNLDDSMARILLDHQPHNLTEARENQIDFQFSGHTHRGQIFPGNLLVNRLFEIGYGYKKIGPTHYYVSSGLGIWGPQYRIGTQSEMVVVQLEY